MTTSTSTTVQAIRKHQAAARTMRRNLRLRLYEGRNSGGSAAEYHEAKAAELMAELPRALQGALTSEHGLALRVSEARDLGQERPELRARLATERRRIKSLVEQG
jgi:hypothetical protein